MNDETTEFVWGVIMGFVMGGIFTLMVVILTLLIENPHA